MRTDRKNFIRKLGVGLIATGCIWLGTAAPSMAHFIGVVGNNSIDGSLCVGFDCVAEEAFGFDTLRLKENNLRIHFQDTSVAASFPPNDWRIIINDSANGGASYFAVEDASAGRIPFRIRAGARSNALYVDAQGDVGIGTSTPALELSVRSGDSPGLRLQQDSSSGFTPQTWDLVGNETSFFIRDATSGSTLPLRIRPGAPSSSIDIASDGDVGLGTASPDASLEVVRTTTGVKDMLELENNGGIRLNMENTATSRTWQIVHSGAAGSSSVVIGNTTNAGAELTIQEDGDLLVLGTISSGGTQLNVPDYVFETDYQLMPLNELESFIEEKKHLPNIPSQAEVKAKGSVNVTELQMKLLEKIEELTLYTLAQENTINALKTRLAALE